jgi:putative transposase
MCGVPVSFAGQCREVTQLRALMPEYEALNAQSLQVTLKRLDLAYAAFFRRVEAGEEPVGFPRFKSYERYKGWGYKTHGDGWKLIGQTSTGKSKLKHGLLNLSGIGRIKLRGSGRTAGEPKTCEIVHKQGRWYASVTVAWFPKREHGSQGLAFDWGVSTFATLALDDGTHEEIPNPRTGQQDAERKAELQRELAATKKRSRHRRKVQHRLGRQTRQSQSGRSWNWLCGSADATGQTHPEL